MSVFKQLYNYQVVGTNYTNGFDYNPVTNILTIVAVLDNLTSQRGCWSKTVQKYESDAGLPKKRSKHIVNRHLY